MDAIPPVFTVTVSDIPAPYSIVVEPNSFDVVVEENAYPVEISTGGGSTSVLSGGSTFSFSETGTGGWHFTPTEYDTYLRYSKDGGATWSPAIRFVAFDGRKATLPHTSPLNLDFALATEFRVTPTVAALQITTSNVEDMDTRELYVSAYEYDVAVSFPGGWKAYLDPLITIPAGRECCIVIKALGASDSDMRYSWRITSA